MHADALGALEIVVAEDSQVEPSAEDQAQLNKEDHENAQEDAEEGVERQKPLIIFALF